MVTYKNSEGETTSLEHTIKSLYITSENTHKVSDYPQDNIMAAPKESVSQDTQHFETGSVNNTSVENTSHSDQFSNSSLTNIMAIPKGSLRKFPVEIRQMIFDQIINAPDVPRTSTVESVPPMEKICLVEALRGERDPTLYKEALEMFYKRFTVEVTEQNLERVQEISDSTLSLINHLCISYR